MTEPCPCPFTARLAQACYQHARTMHPTVREEPTDER